MATIEQRDERYFIGDVDVTAWGEADRAALLAEASKIEGVQTAIREMTEELGSPAATLARIRAEREEIEEARAALERAKLDDIIWADLVTKYGKGRVARIDTKGGMVVIRAATEAEATDQGLASAAQTSLAEALKVGREYLVKLVVHPAHIEEPGTVPKPHPVRAIAAQWPGLWDELDYATKDMMDARAKTRRPFV